MNFVLSNFVFTEEYENESVYGFTKPVPQTADIASISFKAFDNGVIWCLTLHAEKKGTILQIMPKDMSNWNGNITKSVNLEPGERIVSSSIHHIENNGSCKL